jgi:hypothetical protein
MPMTHTPGPWIRKVKGPGWYIEASKGEIVAVMTSATQPDMRLMTSAPALLDALESLLSCVAHEHDRDAADPGPISCGGPQHCAVCLARSVLAKLQN